jgi:drug/metabolite transporter (DMT)-like permease
VIVGALPMATAVFGAWLHRQRPSWGFWLCALLGGALVVAFAVLRSGTQGLSLHWADGLLLLALACAAMGYGYGALLSQRMRAEQVISWALVIALPLTIPLAIGSWPAQPVGATAWGALAYVSVFSMWLGFFAWYRGLALGGTVRVSQVQLAQPFFSMLFAVPLLGERLDLLSVGFGLAVVLTVFLGRQAPIHAASPQRVAA